MKHNQTKTNKANNWQIVFFLIGIVFLLVLMYFLGYCEHEWIDATCDNPKMCSKCGETEGEAKDHIWSDFACTTSQTCVACGFSLNPTGHTWIEATCVSPKTCSVCNEIEGEAMGHSTKMGTCSRCEKEVCLVEIDEGFAVVTQKDINWMQEQEDFVDVCIVGTILEISERNDILIIDGDNGKWTVAVGTACDLSSYVGTVCKVYGFSSGGISSYYKTPLVNMNHENNRMQFFDSKTLFPNSFDSVQQFDDKYFGDVNTDNLGTVWIPTNGGTKYHSRCNCSYMDNPKQVKLEEALKLGFTKCGKCW